MTPGRSASTSAAAARPGRGRAWLRALEASLPRQRDVDEPTFRRRHQWMVAITLAHIPVLLAIGVAREGADWHVVQEMTSIVAMIVISRRPSLGRMARMLVSTTALVACSTFLVHTTGGLIESHFHFFVVVALVSLYQAWPPLLVCLVWVVLHHGVIGMVAPQEVYNHAAALTRPGIWALIHGGYVLAACAVNIVAWRLTDRETERLQSLLDATVDPTYGRDQDGSVTFVNRAATALARLTEDEAVGRPDHEVFGHGGAEKQCPLCLQLAGGDVRDEQATLSIGGRPVPVELSTSRVGRGEGQVVVTFRDVRSRLAAEEQLQSLALRDQVTGLANRTLLQDRLTTAVRALRRTGGRVAVLLCDLDGFKQVNSRGHAVGDALLAEVGARLQDAVRGADTVARLGADEFVVLLDEVDDDGAGAAADRILHAMRRPFDLAGSEVWMGMSIGVAISTDPEVAPDDLLRQADVAASTSKDLGGDRASRYTRDVHRSTRERIGLERDLERAIRTGGLELHYQPKVSLATGTVVGFEALTRWTHPARGRISPGEFIPIAEASGLIVDLGVWALVEACRQLGAWQRPGAHRRLTMAVNVSPVQLGDPTLVGLVVELLDRYGLAPHQLCLEITETALIHETDRGMTTVQALHDLGVVISIDDFGTGYSSLATLRRLPVSELKVDRAFLEHVGDADGGPDRVLLRAVVAMARALGLRTVAEGLEDHRGLEVLRELGCDQVQGFVFSPAVRANTARAMLRGDAVLAPTTPVLTPG